MEKGITNRDANQCVNKIAPNMIDDLGCLLQRPGFIILNHVRFQNTKYNRMKRFGKTGAGVAQPQVWIAWNEIQSAFEK